MSNLEEETVMSDQFDPTRRCLLAASALAVTGLVFDDAWAQPLSPINLTGRAEPRRP
jgi:hypothetical protein